MSYLYKAGSIIPIMEEMNYIGEKENKVLHLEIYSSKMEKDI